MAGADTVTLARSVSGAGALGSLACALLDAGVVQGHKAGGHRAMFLESDVAAQVGLFALLLQVADAVSIPAVAAGGIADARGIVAAFALGACGVQMATAHLFCSEAKVAPLYRHALLQATDTGRAVTNRLHANVGGSGCNARERDARRAILT